MFNNRTIQKPTAWSILLFAIVFLSACGGGGGGAPAVGGGNPPPSGGGGGTLPTGFAVFTSNRNQLMVNEPWVVSFDGTVNRSLAAGLPAGGNVKTLAARLSPDGRYLAAIFDSGTDHSYAIINIATGTPVILPFNNPTDGTLGHNFSWSPDSSRVILNRFSVGSFPNYTPYRVYLMNADGSNIAQPVVSSSDDLFSNSWSPAGTHFAASSRPIPLVGGMPNPDESMNLFMVTADGSSAVDIAPGIGFKQSVFTGHWAADGSTFAFRIRYLATANASDESYQILVHDLNTGVTSPLVSSIADGLAVKGVSANGNWVAYLISPSGTSLRQLNVIAASGGAGVSVAPISTGSITQITWEPIGDKLAYVHNISSGSGGTDRVLYIADPSGSFRALHASTQTAAGFAWSPDGRYIAFSTTDPAALPNGDIYVYDTVSASPAVRLTVEAEFSRGGGPLIWSPDSQWLYTQQFDDNQQSTALRAYPAGNWSSSTTLGLGIVGTPANFTANAEEWGNVAIYPTSDSSAVVWRRRDTNTNITDVMFSDPTDPSLTRAISQAPASSGPFVNVEQLFAR